MKQRISILLAAIFVASFGNFGPTPAAWGQAESGGAVQGTAVAEPTASVDAVQGTGEIAVQSTGAAIVQGTQAPAAQPTAIELASLTPEQIFKGLDTDGDQQLSLAEFIADKRGIDEVEARGWFANWDTDHNDKLSLSEYKAGLAAQKPWYKAWYSVLGIGLIVVLVSLAFGTWVGPLLRMPEASWKFTLVALAILAALFLMWLRWPPKLGIDLNGGTTLVYELDKSERAAMAEITSQELMRRMIDQITKRVDPAGVKLVTIRSVGNDAIEVIVPEVDPTEVAMLKRILKTTGHLEFRILADKDEDSLIVQRAGEVDWKVQDPDTDALRGSDDETMHYLIGQADEMETKRADAVKKGEKPTPQTIIPLDGRAAAEWRDVPAAQVAATKANRDLVTRTLGDKLQKLVVLGDVKARWVPIGKDEKGRIRLDSPRAVTRPRGSGIDVLVMIDRENVEGKYLTQARASMGAYQGNEVAFGFNSEGSQKFGDLTGANLPKGNLKKKLGIILDDELLSAPDLIDRISGEGRISGNFSKKEVEWLAGVLNAGSLPAKLNPTPIRETVSDPTLGAETIRKGETAILISLVIVPLVMIAIYRFAGLVAGVAVMVNLLLVVAVMVSVQAAFTLAGLAGLVLTVGMSVDANVLIYERIREELERGATLRMAIRNGFSRATRTIVDANVTNIITAVVLYSVGTEQLKGFAVTLILGILMSMFTAIFCARLVLDVFEKNRWISTLSMAKVIGHTDINFVGAMRYCIVGTIVVISIGMVAVFLRGREFLDVDFGGGTKIEIVFAKPHLQKDVVERLERDSKLDAVTATAVGKRTQQGENTNFAVETVERDLKVVQAVIKNVFKGELKTNKLSFNEDKVMMIPSAIPSGGLSSAKGDLPAENTMPETAPSRAPATGKPAEGQPTPSKPKPGDGAHRLSSEQSPILMATIDPQVLFFGQATATQGTAASQPTAAPPTAEVAQSTSLPAVQPTGAVGDAVTGATPDVGAAPLANPFAGGSMAELNFEDPIKQGVLKEMIQQAGREAGFVKMVGDAAASSTDKDERLVELDFQFQVSNPEVVGDSQLAVNSWTLKTTLDRAKTITLINVLRQRLMDEPIFPMAMNVGEQVADAMKMSALKAILVSFAGITLYLWFRFQHVRYGLAAVVSLIHDVLITVGLLALSKYFAGVPTMEAYKMNLVILAAILTLCGYSLNDTIVIFDRIRELKGKSPHITKELVNAAVNQTLSRTLLTSALTFLVMVVLYFVGGSGIHGFSFTLLIGIIVGTFSSIYIAAPVLLWMEGTGIGGAVPAPTRPPRGSERTTTPTVG